MTRLFNPNVRVENTNLKTNRFFPRPNRQGPMTQVKEISCELIVNVNTFEFKYSHIHFKEVHEEEFTIYNNNRNWSVRQYTGKIVFGKDLSLACYVSGDGAQWVRKLKKVQQKIKKGAYKKLVKSNYCKNCLILSS